MTLCRLKAGRYCRIVCFPHVGGTRAEQGRYLTLLWLLLLFCLFFKNQDNIFTRNKLIKKEKMGLSNFRSKIQIISICFNWLFNQVIAGKRRLPTCCNRYKVGLCVLRVGYWVKLKFRPWIDNFLQLHNYSTQYFLILKVYDLIF